MDIAESLKILGGVWRWWKRAEANERQRIDDVISVLCSAGRKTVAYKARFGNGTRREPETEQELAQLWESAAVKLRTIDGYLASKCFIKSCCWADWNLWNRPDFRNLTLDADEMVKEIAHLVELLGTEEDSPRIFL